MKPLYTPIDVDTTYLKCRFIDDHPLFVNLVSEIQRFNSKINESNKKQTHMEKYKIKVRFFLNLRKQLQEIVFTKDREL